MLINLEDGEKGLMQVILPNVISQVLQKLSTIAPKHKSLRKALYETLMAGMLQNANVCIQQIF